MTDYNKMADPATFIKENHNQIFAEPHLIHEIGEEAFLSLVKSGNFVMASAQMMFIPATYRVVDKER